MLRLCHSLHSSPDGLSRKRALLSGLCDLLGADAGLNVVAHVGPRRRENIVSLVRHGPSKVCEKKVLGGCISRWSPAPRDRGGADAPDDSPPVWNSARPSGLGARVRRLHHYLWSPAAPDVTVIACLCIARHAKPSKPFRARERTLLELAHTEMSWIYQHDRIPTAEGINTLSPRQRQTLQFLLAGHSEKEIAEIMTLSRNTVHHHVKALHRHFGVSSRSELLAKWVRSGQMEES